MVSKVESFIRRLRWALFFILYPATNTKMNTYGFPSNKPAPSLPELKPFEDDLLAMVKGIQFRPVNNQFQRRLSEDIRRIHNSDKVIVSADKSDNKYIIPAPDYEDLLRQNITKEYKKSATENVQDTNAEAATLAEALDIDDRVEKFIEADAYLTIKDHKPTFPTGVECRLLNPAKSNLGQVSSKILKEAIRSIKKKSGLNLWTNSQEVTDWFSGIDKGCFSTFFKFDVVNFYPTITENLLVDALDWANPFHQFSSSQIRIIKHARRAFLFSNNQIWEKKQSPDFDVTMGSYDGAECCEIVGLFILSKLEPIFGQNVGLYRDDGLGVLRHSGPEAEQIKKKVQKLFSEMGLKITVDTHISEVEFLDLWLDIKRKCFKPYRKNNNIPSYIHFDSNHPTSIKKHLPNMISARISSLSSSKEIFNAEKPFYDAALQKAGYKDHISYVNKPDKSGLPRGRRIRSRKVIWFNPPYSQNVKTNVAGKFLKLIDQHFGSSNLKKHFNRQTIKVSYSTTANMDSIISGHNKSVLGKAKINQTNLPQQQLRTCNCRNGPNTCPLSGNCLIESIIYEASVTSDQETKRYIGLASTSFKQRYSNHMKSFNHEKYESNTQLSNYIWSLKRENKIFDIKWSIKMEAKAYHPARKKCDLCLAEKVLILTSEDTLNGRTEIFQKCRHKNKFLLCNA